MLNKEFQFLIVNIVSLFRKLANMRKIIIPIILLLSMGYCADRYYQSQKANELRQDAKRAKFEKNKATIKSLVQQYSANYNWYRLYARPQRSFDRPIFQADLENEWLGQYPIIFFGKIDDYKNVDGDRYLIRIKPDIFALGVWNLDVGLDLLASKSMFDNFIKAHPQVLSSIFGSEDSSVVVIAKVNSIETRWESSGESSEKIKYGYGELVEIRTLEGRPELAEGHEVISEIDKF